MKKRDAVRVLRIKRIVEFCLGTLFPVSIMTFGIIPPLFHYLILAAVAVYAGFVIRYRRWTRYELGFRRDTIVHWKPYAACTVMAVSVIWAVHRGLAMPEVPWVPSAIVKLAAVSVILSVAQEFLYRGYIFRLFQDITRHPLLVIVPNILVFTFMHTIFPHWEVVIPLTCAGGILFAVLYSRYPNFWLVSGMHFVLNFTALYLGFFPVQILKLLGSA